MTTNTNCLEGMKCPECGYEDEFIIAAQTWATIGDDGCEDHADIEYDETAACKCRECNYIATVGVFLGEPPKLKFPEERMAVISTSHVSNYDRNNIESMINSGDLNGMIRPEGWLVHTDGGVFGHDSINNVLSKANAAGFQWLLFDCDGEQIEGLPTYDWSPFDIFEQIDVQSYLRFEGESMCVAVVPRSDDGERDGAYTPNNDATPDYWSVYQRQTDSDLVSKEGDYENKEVAVDLARHLSGVSADYDPELTW